MGSACNQCLKNGISKYEQVSQDSVSEPNVRMTRHIKTGYTFENISFFITTQPLAKTKLDIVVMFVDKLEGLIDNPYIKELGNRDKISLQKRIQQIREKIAFEREGDYVNMVSPFEKCRIDNLLLGKVGLLFRNEELVLSESIEKIFQETYTKCENIGVPSIGLVQIHSKLGYSSAKFQTEVLKHLHQLFRNKKATFVYFTFTQERLENFINFLLNPENEISRMSHTFSSSTYF